jgi:hypothetical protein
MSKLAADIPKKIPETNVLETVVLHVLGYSAVPKYKFVPRGKV